MSAAFHGAKRKRREHVLRDQASSLHSSTVTTVLLQYMIAPIEKLLIYQGRVLSFVNSTQKGLFKERVWCFLYTH